MKVLLVATNDQLAVNILQSLAVESIRADIMTPRRLRWASLSRYGDKCVSCKIESLLEPDSEFVDAINRHCVNENIDMLIPVDALPMACLAKIRHMITIPVFPIPTLGHILRLNNKWQFKQLLDKLDIPTPETVLLNSREERLRPDVVFPVVVKPLDREGRVGVKRLDSKDDMEAYFSDKKNDPYWPFLIQEYIPGHDICISILSEQGEVIYWTIQERSSQGDIQFIEYPDILQSAREICTKLKYTGLAHFDVRIDSRDNSIKFLECNPRFWGSLVASTFAGINFTVLGIGLGLGQPRPTEITYRNGLLLFDWVTNLSIIKLLIRRRIPFNRTNIRYLLQTLCDPLLVLSILTRRVRKRLAKIFIPGKIRHKRSQRRKQMRASVPLSAIETYADHVG